MNIATLSSQDVPLTRESQALTLIPINQIQFHCREKRYAEKKNMPCPGLQSEVGGAPVLDCHAGSVLFPV